jgi:hypothetical protein
MEKRREREREDKNQVKEMKTKMRWVEVIEKMDKRNKQHQKKNNIRRRNIQVEV